MESNTVLHIALLHSASNVWNNDRRLLELFANPILASCYCGFKDT